VLARLYLAADRARRRIGVAIDGTWTGFWLGILRPADLHVVDEIFYASRPSYHADEHNRRGLFDWEAYAMNKHFPSSGVLRLIGAGGGREVLALSQRGFAVEAYECNPSLVASANVLLATTSPHAEVRFLARDCAPTAMTKADGIIVGWSAYMLISSRARRIALLNGLRTGASNGTPLLISFFTRSVTERRLQFIAKVATTVRRLRGSELPELGDDLAPLFVHRFAREEIEAELAAAKFQLIEFREEGSGPYDSGFAVAIARYE